MVNSTQLNTTVTVKANKDTVRFTISIFMFLFMSIFVYFMAVILNVFFTTPKVRESIRYILFIHMLLNDVFYLFITFLLLVCYTYIISIPLPICYIIISFSTCTFAITPYNLAVMSLERYTAICHPLRHTELWTSQRATFTIANMWMVGMIPQLAYFIAYCFAVDKRVFCFNVMCEAKLLTVSREQEIIKTLFNFLSLFVVGMIIIYTYIRVMLVARRVDSKKFASKAAKTVLLHGFQLLLSMLSFTSSYTETYFSSNFPYLTITNFFLLTCFPRFISPLIYGIRDEVFGKAMRRFFSTAKT